MALAVALAVAVVPVQQAGKEQCDARGSGARQQGGREETTVKMNEGGEGGGEGESEGGMGVTQGEGREKCISDFL